MSEVLRIDDLKQDGRFSRFELIGWWDQTKLASANALVIGAGAIGNEIIKNLALVGIGKLFVADLDNIENSNLSRSILYREADCGRSKAEVAAEKARDIYPEMQTQAFHGNVVYDLGLGVYRWADVILGGLDNREARVAINSAAARVGQPWIDGAIERLNGVARVFDPAVGPCYECTMSEIDWKMLEARRSCALLSREEMEAGKVPTTPTTSSIIAGIQVQEAIKILHGLDALDGQGFVFDGVYHQSYTVTYSRQPDCPSHEAYEPIHEMPWSATTRVGDVLEYLNSVLGETAVLEFNQDLLASLHCVKCNETEPWLSSLGQVSEKDSRCPNCKELRTPELYHHVSGDSLLLDKTFLELGVPRWDILGGRAGTEIQYFEFAGDKEAVLGPIAESSRTDTAS